MPRSARSLGVPLRPTGTASGRANEAMEAFQNAPARSRSLNEMKKGGKVTFRKGKARGKK